MLMQKASIGQHGPIYKKIVTALILSLSLVTILFFTSEFTNAISSPFIGKIRITPDGTVEGTDKIRRDNNIYTLTGDLSGSIENGQTFISIEKDNVILNGAGKTIKGTGTGVAIVVYGRKDVTIKNTRIINFGTGIELRAFDWEFNITGENNRILDNYLETTYWGIDLNTNNCTVLGNKIVSAKSYYGVNFHTNNTVFSNNEFEKGGLVIFEPCYQNLVYGNTVNGKPLVYMERQANQVIDGAGQVYLIDCNNMIARNISPTVGLRMTITLLGTSNTQITNCIGNIALKNSHSNIIVDNELRTDSPIVSFQDSAIELTTSHNNTIANNSITATKGYGISIVASVYNKIQGNTISSTGYAAIKIEAVQYATSTSQQFIPEYNYVYENYITCTETGISLRTARNTVVFKNSIFGCKDAIMLSGSHENQFLGNNITSSTRYGIYLGVANYNAFHHNNFLNNTIQAYENHKVYWWYVQNDTYYSVGNTFDDDKQGNYWSDYTGTDTNGDGIGETPYTVYENKTDRYPLTKPYNINNVVITPEKWVPNQSQNHYPTEQFRIIIHSPQNITYNTVPNLNLVTSASFSWLGYSLDNKPNATITGNITLTDLPQGVHSLIVYGNNTEGTDTSTEMIYFTIERPPSFPTLLVTGFSVAAIITLCVGLAYLFKKRKL